MRSRFQRKRIRGFTLVELLIVILILAILMAVALPLYLESVTEASKRGCRANMHSMANAAQAWKVRSRYPDFSTLNVPTDLIGDLGSVPVCADGGTYRKVDAGSSTKSYDGTVVTVPAGGFGVECTYGEHHGFVPGVTND
ncbi:MAG TPA: prepilin-type N-terminal cleavage/methylation domain-containing protein [Fimbriimonas sp.]